MTGFSADWLALREPYDAEACDAAVRDAALAAIAGLDPVAIVDLGCGTGSGLRALAPLAPARQNWRLVDNDLSLLARAADGARPDRVQVTAVPVDLAHDLEAALDGAVDLVTTTALLDLVSEPWLERLAVECAARRLPLYATLSYDGRIEFKPDDPGDAAIVAAVNAHQRGDKGFGPALGRKPRPRRSRASRRLATRSSTRPPIGCCVRRIARCRTRCSPAGRARRANSALRISTRSSDG